MTHCFNRKEDIYHLVLQALVYNRHLSRLHSVRSATTTETKKESSLYLLHFQQVLDFLNLSYHTRLRLCVVSKDCATPISVKDSVLRLLQHKQAKQGSDSFIFYYTTSCTALNIESQITNMQLCAQLGNLHLVGKY